MDRYAKKQEKIVKIRYKQGFMTQKSKPTTMKRYFHKKRVAKFVFMGH